MQKWEYRVLTLIGTRYTIEYIDILELKGEPAYYRWAYEESLLRELGDQGWELVATYEESPNEVTPSGTPKLIFKRPISS